MKRPHSIPCRTRMSIAKRSRKVLETLAAAWLIARKDLTIEFRTRSAFFSAVVFALLGLVIFYYAWDPTAVAAIDLAPGVLWVIFTFSGILGLNRSFGVEDRKSTRLNSSHLVISYAVFCLKKKNKTNTIAC